MKDIANSGISLIVLVTAILVVLKLVGFIRWSWLWVFSPIWIYAIIAAVIFVSIFIAIHMINK